MAARWSSVTNLLRGIRSVNTLFQQKAVLPRLPATLTRLLSASAKPISNTDATKPNNIQSTEDSKRSLTLVERVKAEICKDQNRDFLFAIVQFGGRQYKIAKGDVIITQKIQADCGDRIKLEKVLLVGGKDFTVFGKPLVSRDHVNIEGLVVENFRGKKLIIFKKKKRKGYKRKNGHRQQLTAIRIDSLTLDPIVTN